ncbi:MAG TPA: hypothetical protein VOA78_02710 [Candidatus Dormibacteraeota bacterium]|nr:hypothetical protein [Candidatus Dormibacteraeota bacterium]
MTRKSLAIPACFALLAMCCATSSSEQPYKTFVKGIEHQYFALRANEALCRRSLAWDKRTIWECRVTPSDRSIAINGVNDWEGRYFVSGKSYRLKSAKLDGGKNVLELKVWGEPVSRGFLEDEIRLEIPDASQLDVSKLESIFFGIFLRPSENKDAYEAAINRKLIERYLDPEPELFALPEGSREKVLLAIRLMGFPPQPQIEKVGRDLYIPANFIPDSNVYNDIRVSKNQRLATTIEKQLKDVRIFAKQAAELPVIKGIKFQWSDFHKSFLEESASPTEERLEMLVPLPAIGEFLAGNLSAFELVQKSTLRADGMKVTLTSYDPIGSQ